MIKLRLSEIAVEEIISALRLSAREWKKGMPQSAVPFSETVLQHIEEQMADV